jgi:FdhD protein
MSAQVTPAPVVAAPAYYRYTASTGLQPETKQPPLEAPIALHINGRQWVTLLCTPSRLRPLALGFLYTSRVIERADDILYMRICEEDGVIEVGLPEGPELDAALSRPRTLTSGCGGGTSFEAVDGLEPLPNAERVLPDRVLEAMHALHAAADGYRESGGIHTCALSDEAELLLVAEDVGRHNALDKVVGECLWTGLDPAGKWVLSSGRISSEMALKAARLGAPVVISHTSPTSLAIDVARLLNVTLIGYAKAQRFSVYSGVERVVAAGAGL